MVPINDFEATGMYVQGIHMGMLDRKKVDLMTIRPLLSGSTRRRVELGLKGATRSNPCPARVPNILSALRSAPYGVVSPLPWSPRPT